MSARRAGLNAYCCEEGGLLEHRERVDVDDDAALEIASVLKGGEQGAAHLTTLWALEQELGAILPTQTTKRG